MECRIPKENPQGCSSALHGFASRPCRLSPRLGVCWALLGHAPGAPAEPTAPTGVYASVRNLVNRHRGTVTLDDLGDEDQGGVLGASGSARDSG
jgi:hypothetical protein